MLRREELEASYLEHVSAARRHLDEVTGGSPVSKGLHLAQALAEAQLATAAATALANNVMPWRTAIIPRPAEETGYSVTIERDERLGGQDRLGGRQR